MLCDLPEDLLVQISCAFYLFDTDKDGLLKTKDFLKTLSQNQIRLPESRNIMVNETHVDYSNQIVSWKSFYNVFGSCYGKNKIDGVAGNIFDELIKKCKEAKINISPRVLKAINKYWFSAQALFESKETDASIIALDYAIAQRILPHINGNGQTYKEKLIALQDFCNQNNLQMSSEIIKDIIQKGDESMQYFQYFA